MTPIQQDIQASYVRITQKALSLACGRGDIIQRIAIRAGYRQPEDEEKMLAKLFPSADQAHVVEPKDDPVLAAVMWLMAEGWSDDKILYMIAKELGLGEAAYQQEPTDQSPLDPRQHPPLAFARHGDGGEVDWFCVGCRRPLWACDDDTCRGHECRASGPIGGTTFCDGSCRRHTTSTCLERRKLDRALELLGAAAAQTTARSDLEPTSPLSAAARDQLDKLAGEVRQQLDAGHMVNGNDLDRLARWAQQAARYGVADPAWRQWAAKILAAYPWVDEFKPDDSDEKYRDGVRYVLLCIECNGSGSDADNQEMKAIRDRWGFS